jgi:hypothetical protein
MRKHSIFATWSLHQLQLEQLSVATKWVLEYQAEALATRSVHRLQLEPLFGCNRKGSTIRRKHLVFATRSVYQLQLE